MSVEILDLAALALTAVFFALLYYLQGKKYGSQSQCGQIRISTDIKRILLYF